MPKPLAWTFPVPVTPSRFQALSPRWSAWNIQTCPSAVGAWSFARSAAPDVAWYDLQTQPDANTRGRHGSGRAAVYRGYHVKGLGRTPAAANWNDRADHYHASGYMSPGSALRELLITRVLRERGLGAAAVGCETILLGALDAGESKASVAARSARQKHFAPADRHMIALSLKRANFARHSNFIWALDHNERETAWIGRLLIEFERLLQPPSPAPVIDGSPEAVAAAMDAAFERAFQRMLDFAAHGLFWIHHHNNYTLDGRWVDLETPLFSGHPFVGLIRVPSGGGPLAQVAGFECFDMVRSWRLFLDWLDRKLDYLALPGMLDHELGAGFVKSLRAAVRKRFREESALYRDRELKARAAGFLADKLGATGADRRRLADLGAYCFRVSVQCANEGPPDLGWIRLPEQPAPPSPGGVVLFAAPFASAELAPAARAYAAELARLGERTDPGEILAALRGPAKRSST